MTRGSATLCLVAAAAVACGEEPTTATGAPTLSDVQADVFDASCAFSTCHAAPGASGLALEPGGSHAALVGVPSADAPGEVLVIPGDSAGSYLVAKLRGDPGIVGDPMPDGGPLDAARLQLVVDWIDAGALDD